MLELRAGKLVYRRSTHSEAEPFTLVIPRALRFSRNSLVVLRGPNGVGKSTLLRHMAGMGRGRIDAVDAECLWDQGSGKCASSLVCSFLKAHPQFFPTVTVRAYLTLASRSILPKPVIEEQERALERFGLAEDLWDKTPRALSTGQRQRLGLARIAIQRSPLVLLDEPTSNLDMNGAQMVRSFLDELVTTGTLVIVATHNKEDIARATSVVDFSVVASKMSRVQEAVVNGSKVRIA